MFLATHLWPSVCNSSFLQVKKAAVVGGVAAASVGIIALGSALLYLLNEEERDIMTALTQQDERKYLGIFWVHSPDTDYDLTYVNKLLLHVSN